MKKRIFLITYLFVSLFSAKVFGCIVHNITITYDTTPAMQNGYIDQILGQRVYGYFAASCDQCGSIPREFLSVDFPAEAINPDVSPHTMGGWQFECWFYEEGNFTITLNAHCDYGSESVDLPILITTSSPTVTLTTESSDGGNVTTPSENPYTCDTGEPVLLEVNAEDGYHFDHWEWVEGTGIIYGEYPDEDMWIRMGSDCTIRAVFKTNLCKGPYLIYTGDYDSMTVNWQFTDETNCTLKWNDTPDFESDVMGNVDQNNTLDPDYLGQFIHRYKITGLTPGTTYYYQLYLPSGQEFPSSFRTAPADDAGRVKFMVTGDCQDDDEAQETLWGQMISVYENDDPEYQTILLQTGDKVESDEKSSWDEFFDRDNENTRTLLEHMALQSCIGNHETRRSGTYGQDPIFCDRYWPYPYVEEVDGTAVDEHYWSFDYGPAHFVVVDQYAEGIWDYSNPTNRTGDEQNNVQLDWLADDLSSTNKPWKFIILHEPGYSAGGYHSDNSEVQNDIQLLCETYGVDIVFAGHQHYYARSEVDGVQHVINLGGDDSPRDCAVPGTSGYDDLEASESTNSFNLIEIDGSTLEFTARRSDGSEIESFSLYKESTLLLDKGSSGEGNVFYKLDNQTFIPIEVPYSKNILNGTSISVKAEPALHYAFMQWEDFSGNTYSTENPLQLILEEDLSLRAIFEYVVYSPVIQNVGTTQIDKDSARIQGSLISTGGQDPTVYLYYGTEDGGEVSTNWGNSPINLGTQVAGNIYCDLSGLDPGTEYYFRFCATNSAGSDWAGNVITFTTAPNEATGLTPANGTPEAPLSVDLYWTAGQGAVSHNVYFGTTDPPPLRAVVSAPPYTVSSLSYNEDYYWRIDEVGVQEGVTSGQTISFSTLDGYELTALATEGGSISVDGGENNTPTMFQGGSDVTLTANPDNGYYFVEWQGDTTGTTITGSQITIPMDQNRSVTAVFAMYPVLTVTVAGEGYVTLTPEKSYYDLNETIALQAIADTSAGYVFDHWEQDLSGNNPQQNLTMDASKTVTAVFTRKVYFVSSSGDDSYSGLSWGDAFATLQKALDMVAVNPDYQIWVKAGTYYPEKNSAPLGTELVDKGDFPSDASAVWTVGSGWSIANDVASHTTGTGEYLGQLLGTLSGSYLVQFEVIDEPDSEPCSLKITLGDVYSETSFAVNQIHTLILSPASGSELKFECDQDEAFSIDNVSVRKINSDRTKTFQLKENVSVYGGFIGNETFLEQRDPEINITMLSGDLGTLDNVNDNSYHVVKGANNAILDGFTITQGNANGAVTLDTCGAGIQCINTSPVIQNCIITENVAIYGGGMHNSKSSPEVVNCIFEKNTAKESGGSIYNELGSPTFENCRFLGNIDECNFSDSDTNPSVELDTLNPDWFWDTSYGQGYNVHEPSENPYSTPYGSGAEYRIYWGDPANSDCNYQSGLGFTSVSLSKDIQFDKPFELGQLSHYNRVQQTDTWALKVKLAIELSFNTSPRPTASFDFFLGINETYNEDVDGYYGGECDPDCCDDFISFPSTYPSQTININGREYILEVLGFGATADALVDEFQSGENNSTNSIALWAKITPPPVQGSVKNISSDVTFNNCSFVGNVSNGTGGALANWACLNVDLTNCTIVSNSATQCGGVYNFDSYVNVVNSILWGNIDSDSDTSPGEEQLYNLSSDPEDDPDCTLTYSCIPEESVTPKLTHTNANRQTLIGFVVQSDALESVSNVEIVGDGWTEGNSHLKQGLAGTNRALIFTVHAENYDGDVDIDRVTYGGQEMTLIFKLNQDAPSSPWPNYRTFVGVYYLNESGIEAADSSGNFVVNWIDHIPTNTNTSQCPSGSYPVSYSSVFLKTVNQDTVIGDISSDGDTSNLIEINELSTYNGDMVIIAGAVGNLGSYTLMNGFTEALELSPCSVDGVVGYKSIASAGNKYNAPSFIRDPDDNNNGWEDDDNDYGDLRLSAGSPCIDAGNNDAVSVGVETDLEGKSRFMDDPDTQDTGVPINDDPYVDMGAYEYQSPSLNQPPVAMDDVRLTGLDIPIEIDILSNDSDPEGDSLEISSYTDSNNGGTVVLSANGDKLLYTPDSGFLGTDYFTYEIQEIDNPDNTAIATVTVNVTNLVVIAGNAKTLVLPESSIYLFDARTEGGLPDSTVTYEWEEVSIPLGASVTYLPDNTTEKPTVQVTLNPEAFTVETPAVFVLRLKAFENGFLAGQDEVRILVYPGDGQVDSHSAPGADIGSAVSGSDSIEIPAQFWDDGKPFGYLQATWSQVSGPVDAEGKQGQAAFSQDTFVIRTDQGSTITTDQRFDATTNTTFTVAGTYKLKLNVWDGNKGNNDYIDVIANAEHLNQKPVVKAGEALSYVVSETDSSKVINLSDDLGKGSPHSSATDPDGDSLEICWIKVHGPLEGVTFSDTHVAAPVLTFTKPGNYVFKLQASDDYFTVDDLLSVTITTPVISMNVDAGQDQIILLPSAADLEGSVICNSSYDVNWSVIKRPIWGQVEFTTPTEDATIVNFVNNTSGTYVFQFEATAGMVSISDTVVVSVYPGLQVSGGFAHSLLRDQDGYVWSFGTSGSIVVDAYTGGILGRDEFTHANEKVLQPYAKKVYSGDQSLNEDYLRNIKDISAGWTHSLALDEDLGKVWVWGGSDMYPTEIGTTKLSDNSTTVVDYTHFFDEPTAVYAGESDDDPESPIENISSVVAGGKWLWGGNSYFLNNDGYVLACGSDAWGQLGNGFDEEVESAAVPEYVLVGEQNNEEEFLNNIVSVDGGVGFALALEKIDPENGFFGHVYSWGTSLSGALGIGTDLRDVTIPFKVFSGKQDSEDDQIDDHLYLENIIEIAAGSSFSMALEKYDPKMGLYGRVFTWGRELDSFTNFPERFNTEVLGDGIGPVNQYKPVLVLNGEQDSTEVPYLSGIIAISAGGGHAMALEKYDPEKGYYGRVFTWGANKYRFRRRVVNDDSESDTEACGVLGNGETGERNSPEPVIVCAGEQSPENPYSELKNIISIAAGAEHCMAIDIDGKVWSWGVNGLGQLGTGDWNSTALPRQVTFDQKVHNVTQNTWYFGEIQLAIDEASTDDEIVIYPGQYSEKIVIPSDRSLSISSIDPSDWDIVNKTIIDGTNISLTADEGLVNIGGPNVELRGFTIQNSLEHGIKITDGDDIKISNNIISGNSKNGIDISTATVEVRNNFIVKNGLLTDYGSDETDKYHGINLGSGACSVINNTIVLNSGHGICQTAGSHEIKNSIVWNNILEQLQNCTSVNSITDTDPGLNNAPSTVDKTTQAGSVDGIYVSDATLYNPGQIIEYADDGIPRVVIVVDATCDYVRFSPALTFDATQEDKVISFWYSIDSVIITGDPVTTSANGNGYNGDENAIEVPSSKVNEFEIGDIIQYEGQYREILGKDETEYTLMVYDGMGEGIPLDSSSEEGREVYNYGSPNEWGLNLSENYHLQYSGSSYSIDQLSSWTGIEQQTDIDGHPRLIGGAADIGADEYTAVRVNAGQNKQISMPLDGSAASLYLSEASVLWGDFDNVEYPNGEIAVEWNVVDKPDAAIVGFSGLTETPENEIRPMITFTQVGTYLLQLKARNGETVIGGDRIVIDVLPGIDAGGPYEARFPDTGEIVENINLDGIVSGLAESGFEVTWTSSNNNCILITEEASLTEAYATIYDAVDPSIYGIKLEVKDSVSQTVLGTDTAFVICNYEQIHVDAGNDKDVKLSPVNHRVVVPLCGTVSGYTASHVEWELISGSINAINFEASNTENYTSVAFTEPGTYDFGFHVYDDHYNKIGTDIVAVSVSSQTVTVDAGQDQFINEIPYLINLEGSINAQEVSQYSTRWFCTSEDIQFGNATHPNTWVRFTSTPAAGKYTCVLVAYDSQNNIVAADSTIIIVDGGVSWIPSPVISAGETYGPVSVGEQCTISGQILDGDSVYSTMWIAENSSNVLIFGDSALLETTVTSFETGQQVISLLAFDEGGEVIGVDSAYVSVGEVAVDAKISQIDQNSPVDQLDTIVDSFGPYEFLLQASVGIDSDNIHTKWIYEGPDGAAYIYEPSELETEVSISEIGRHVFAFKIMNGEQVIAYDITTVNIGLSGFYIDILGSDRNHYWNGSGIGTEQFRVLSYGQIPDPSASYQWSSNSNLVELNTNDDEVTATFYGIGDFSITCTLYDSNGAFLAEDTVVIHVTYGYEVNAGKDRAVTLEGGSVTLILDDAFIVPINPMNESFKLLPSEYGWLVPQVVEHDVTLDWNENDVNSKLHPVVTIYDTGIYELTLWYAYCSFNPIEDKVRVWVYPEETPLMVNAGDNCSISSPTNSYELEDAWVLPSDTSVTWSVQGYPNGYPPNGPQVVFDPSENTINPRVYFPTIGTYTLRVQPQGQSEVYDDITITLDPWDISSDVTSPTAEIDSATYDPGDGLADLTDGQDDVNGSINITVSGCDETDGSGMQMLELVLVSGDERIQLEKTEESPWQISYVLNTCNLPNGTHTLIAYAKDKAGNIGVSTNPISFTSTTNSNQNPISNLRVGPECATDLIPSLTFTATLATAYNWELFFDTESTPRASGNSASISELVNVINLEQGEHQAVLKVTVDTYVYQANVVFAVCTEENILAEISALKNLESQEAIYFDQESDFEALNNHQVDGSPPPVITENNYELIGTADHPKFQGDLYYQVVLYDNDRTNYINVTPNPTLGGYTHASVNNATLATLDLSTLPNGVYNLELFVRCKSIISSTKTQFILDCPLKIGNVKFSQQDLSISLGGMPLQVIRSYDSFQKETMGDFGFGWTYALTSMDIELNEPAPTENGASGGYFDRDVTLTLPDGQRTTFQFELQSCSGHGIKNWKGVYNSADGVSALLRTKDSETLVYGGGWGGVDYFWDGHYPGILADGESVNLGLEDFSGFVLQTEDGTQYNIERERYGEVEVRSPLTGQVIYTYDSYGKPYLESIYLPSGETIKFLLSSTSTNENPVIKEVLYFSSDVPREDLPVPITEDDSERNQSLKSIEFERDGANRIIAINAPSESGELYEGGNPTVKYDYDDNGNLEAVHVLKNKDTSEYDTTYYLYDDGNLHSPEDHYVTDIQDPRGLTPIRYLYDNSGKLIGTMDAKKNKVMLRHALEDGNGTYEEVTDRNDNIAKYYYNDRGNVVIVQKYDSESVFLSQTEYTYDSYSSIIYNDGQDDYPLAGEENGYTNLFPDQPCVVTDNAGNSTYTRYDQQGRITQTIDPVLNKTVNEYDNSGNLTVSSHYKPKRDTYGDIDILTTGKVEFEEVSATENIYNTNQMLVFTGARKGTVWYSINLSYYDDQNRLIHSVQVNMDDDTKDQPNEVFSDLDAGILINVSDFQNNTHVVTTYDYTGSSSPDQPYSITDASGQTQYFHYNANNQQVASWYLWDDPDTTVINPDKRIINLSILDSMGRAISTYRVVDDTTGNISDYLQENFGNADYTQLSDTSYNSIGKVDYTIDPASGLLTKYLYDETGNTVETLVYKSLSDYTTYFFGDGVTSGDEGYPLNATGILSISRTLYDSEGRTIVSVGPYECDAAGNPINSPVGTETVYDALGRVVETRRWANVDIWYDYIPVDIPNSTERDILYVSLREDDVAHNAWKVLAGSDILAWSSDNQIPIVASTLLSGQIGPLSYTRTIYDVAGRVRHSIALDETGKEQPTSYEYDAAGRQTIVIDPQGHYLDNPHNDIVTSEPEIQLNGVANPTKRIDFANFDYSENYYVEGDTATTSNFTGTHITETVYDGTRRDYVVDAADNTTFFTYDTLGRVIKTQHPPTNIDGTNQPPGLGEPLDTNPIDLEDDYLCDHVEYDGLGRRISEYQEMWHYNQSDGTDSTPYLNKQKSYDYDSAGRLITVTLPQVPDPEDLDENDNPIVKNPVYQYYYDDFGNQLGIHDPKGRLTVFRYDHLNRQTHKYMPFVNGAIDRNTEFYSQINLTAKLYEYTEYDTLGRVTLQLDYKEQGTAYIYDNRDRLEYKRYYQTDGTSDGVNTNYPDNYTEEIYYTYDNLNRKKTETVTDRTGTPVVTYSSWIQYDNESRIDYITTQNGTGAQYKMVDYEYNSITGQKSSTNVLTSSDNVTFTPTSQSADYTYDSMGRLQTVGDSSAAATYAYTAVGSRASIQVDTDGNSGFEFQMRYIYNNLNRLTNLYNETTDGGQDLSTFTYTLAADGMRTGVNEFLKYPTSGADESPAVSYTYDNLNRLTDESNYNSASKGYTANYTYDLVGNRTERLITITNDTGTSELKTCYSYYSGTDKLYQEINHSTNVTCAAIPLGNDQYAYAHATDNGVYYKLPGDDTRIGQFKAFWLGLPSVVNSILFYTVMILIPIIFFAPVFIRHWSRLRGSIDPLASPDVKLWHRMLCVLLSYIFLVGPEAFQHFAQAATQYSTLSTAAWGNAGDTITYTYDDNGSMVGKITDDGANTTETVVYEYNLQNRLSKVTTTPYVNNVAQTSKVVTYQYNPQGIRIQSYSYDTPDGGTTRSYEVTTDYLVDSYNHTGYAQVLQETTGSNVTTYLIGDDVLAQDSSVSGVKYLLYDGHGSTRQLVSVSDDSTPVVTVDDSYSYDAYGVMLGGNPTTTAPAATNLLYSGEQFDTNAQQYYLRARYYNQNNGTFNRVDPYAGNTQDPQSLHKYAYCHNNPVNAIDPSGKFSVVLGIAFIAVLSVYVGLHFIPSGHKFYAETSAKRRGRKEIKKFRDQNLDKILKAGTYGNADINALFDAYIDIYPKVTSRKCLNAYEDLLAELKGVIAQKPSIASGIELIHGNLVIEGISEPDNILILMPDKYIPTPHSSVDFSETLSGKGKKGLGWYDTDAKENIIFFYPGSAPLIPVGNLYDVVSGTIESPSPYGPFGYLHVTLSDI